jgi:hypothetical protein
LFVIVNFIDISSPPFNIHQKEKRLGFRLSVYSHISQFSYPSQLTFDVWNESQFALKENFRKPELSGFDFVSLPSPSFLSFFWYSFWTGFFIVAVFFEFCPEFCAGSIIQSVLAIRALRKFSFGLARPPSESNRSILSHCIASFNFSLSNYLIQEDFRKPELAGFDFVSLPLPSFLTV